MVTIAKTLVSEKRSLVAHLMRRAGFGATQKELDDLENQAYDDIVDSILDPGDSNHLPEFFIRRF